MSYAHLTLQERYVIYHLVLYGLSYREIGRRLNRHHTTISREVQRNGPRYTDDGVYYHEAAQDYANQRKCHPRHYRRRSTQQLVHYVENKIRADWSPEKIAGRLWIDYPNSVHMRINPETISPLSPPKSPWTSQKKTNLFLKKRNIRHIKNPEGFSLLLSFCFLLYECRP